MDSIIGSGTELFELIRFGFAFLLAAVLSYYFTPVVKRAAIRFGLIDSPDGNLKQHQQPVAYLGGLAVFGSLLTTVSLAYPFDQTALGILLSTTLVLILGLIDDLGVLSPWIKLGGQGIAVWMLIKAGIWIQIAFLPDWANVLITVVWVVGLTNAFNLIDVMDGLSSGVALVAAIFLSLISIFNGNYLIAAFTVTLAGSLLGFLPHNFKPASIYLGDTGSMTIGFILAALTVNEQYSMSGNWIGLLAPAVIMGIPIYETTFLIIVRLLKGIHPLQGSPDHFALRLKRRGLGVRFIVLQTYFFSMLLGVMGLLMVYAPGVIPLAVLLVVILLAMLSTLFLLMEEIRGKNAKD
jgi:UDP-GlcNAc:undecaprenyl-phosphate GlcNAc-1-phosphate transferase